MTDATKGTIAAPVRRYKPYPAYQDSGVEWWGEIPAHWQVRPLKTLATINLSNVDKKSVEGQETVRLCNYVDVYYHERITNDMEFMTATAAPEQVRRFALERGDVLITKDSESPDDIAVPAVVGEDLPGVICGYHLAHIRPRSSEIQGKFLAQALRGVGLRDQFYMAANGISRFGLTREAIRSALVPVAPVPEQRTIAAFLDRETARIDALVARKERLIELLQEKRAALITHAVTKGLDPDVPMKDSGVEWLGEIPAHWEVLRVGRLFRERDERGFPDLPILNVSIHTGVAVREFSDSRIEQKADDPSVYKRARKGDLAFNKMRMWQGAVGVSPVDGLVSPDYTVARPLSAVEPRYFEELFRTSLYRAEIIRHSHGIVWDRNRLYWDDFKTIKAVVPPQSEQLEILAWVEAQAGKIDALVRRIQEGIDRLEELRTALISAAVTGKIDVRGEVA